MDKYSFFDLKKAIMINCAKPMDKEFDSHDMKSLRVSANKEGDSTLGVMLFAGIATDMGYTKGEINMAEGIEYEEIAFKHAKYREKIKTDKRFKLKVELIKNYLKLQCKKG